MEELPKYEFSKMSCQGREKNSIYFPRKRIYSSEWRAAASTPLKAHLLTLQICFGSLVVYLLCSIENEYELEEGKMGMESQKGKASWI